MEPGNSYLMKAIISESERIISIDEEMVPKDYKQPRIQGIPSSKPLTYLEDDDMPHLESIRSKPKDNLVEMAGVNNL